MHSVETIFVSCSTVPTAAPGFGSGHKVGVLRLERPAVVLSIGYGNSANGSSGTGLMADSSCVEIYQGGPNPEGLRLIGGDKVVPYDVRNCFHMLDLTSYELPEGVYDIRANLAASWNFFAVTVVYLDKES